jgi:hypothetical protein
LGATLAEQHMSSVAKAVAEGSLPRGSVVILDFSELEAINASYIKGTAFWLLTCGQMSTRPVDFQLSPRHNADPRPYNLYVCVTGLTPVLVEEFQEFLKPRGLPLLCASQVNGEEVEEARLLGHLDSILLQTLKVLDRQKRATAPQLFEANSKEGVTVTAWNNRLNDLNGLRLVRRFRAGRAWEYETIAKIILWE